LKNLPYVKTGFPFSCGLRVKWNRKIVTTVAITANTLRIYMCQALCEVPLYVHFLIQTSTTFCGRSCYPHFTEGETEAEKGDLIYPNLTQLAEDKTWIETQVCLAPLLLFLPNT